MSTRTTNADKIALTLAAENYTFDVHLPSRVELYKSLPVVLDAARKAPVYGGELEWTDNPDTPPRIVPLTGSRELDMTKSPNELGMLEGSTYILTATPQTEDYPELIEVMQDAAVHVRNAEFHAWDMPHARKVAAWATPLLTALVCLALVWWSRTLPDSTPTWVMGTATTAVAGLMVALAFNLRHSPVPGFALSLSASAYVPTAAAAWLLIPGDTLMWNLLGASMVTLTVAVAFAVSGVGTPALHYAVATPAGVLVLTAIICLPLGAWRPLTPATAASIASILCLIIVHYVPELARMGAGLELPTLPDLTARGRDALSTNISEVSATLASNSSWDSLVNQRERNILARWVGVGITVGCSVLYTLACGVAGAEIYTGEVSYVAFDVPAAAVLTANVLILSAIFATQGSWYRDKTERTINLIAGGSGVAAFVLAVVITHGDDHELVRYAVVAAVATWIVGLWWSGIAWRAKSNVSTRARRMGELLESWLYIFPLTNVLVLMNIFYSILHR